MVKARRARRNGKVTMVRSGTLAKASAAGQRQPSCWHKRGDIGIIFSPGRPEGASVPLGSRHRPLSFHMLLRFSAVNLYELKHFKASYFYQSFESFIDAYNVFKYYLPSPPYCLPDPTFPAHLLLTLYHFDNPLSPFCAAHELTGMGPSPEAQSTYQKLPSKKTDVLFPRTIY